MKVVFVCRGFESLSVEYLSAFLRRAGHQTQLVYDPTPAGYFHDKLKNNPFYSRFFDFQDNTVEEIVNSNAGLVAFSVVSDSYGWACDIAAKVKEKKNIPVIFGGVHPIAVPERVISQPFVDYLCIGEGEYALLELADALANRGNTKNIANIWAKNGSEVVRNPLRPLIEDLDCLPFPDRDLFYNTYKGFVNDIYWILCGRGCMYSCTFCYNSYFKTLYHGRGIYLRRRSAGNVIEELKWAKQKYNIKKVFFLDDIFTADIDWLREFCRRYKEEKIKLPFYCAIYPLFSSETVEAVSLLEDAGCTAVGMGVQSLNERVRKEILHRQGSNEEIIKIIGLFNKTKMFLYPDIILGIPFQDDAELLSTAKFFNQYKPDTTSIFWLRYYPKTEITRIARDKGVLSPEELEDNEESRNCLPPTDRGSTYDRRKAKLGNLITISCFIPSRLFLFLIKTGFYKILPAVTLHAVNYLASFLVKRVLGTKKGPLYFSVFDRIRYYFYFLSRKKSYKGA